MIYLDNGATTFPKPECVYRAVDEFGRNGANIMRLLFWMERRQ